MTRKYCLIVTLLLSVVTQAAAQEFFNLTADDVRIDSMLPQFTYSQPLGAHYADSTYEVRLEYPEFVNMSEADIARYQAITTAQLPEMPVVDQYVGVSRRQGTLYVSFVPLVFREGRYQKLVSFKLSVQGVAAARARSARRATEASERYATHSVLSTGEWAKIRVPQTGFYQLTDALIREAGFTDASKVKVYGYGGALQPEKVEADYLVATDDLKEVPTCVINGRRLFYAVGPVNWSSATSYRTRNPYSQYGYYFLTEDTESEPLMVDSAQFVSDNYPSANDYHELYEVDNYAWFHGGRNLYDSQLFGVGKSHTYTLAAYEDAEARLVVSMSFDSNYTVTVTVNGQEAGTITPSSGLYNKDTGQLTDSYSDAAAETYTLNVAEIALKEQNEVVLTQTAGGNIRLDYLDFRFSDAKPLPALGTASLPTPEYVYRITNQDHHADEAADMIILIPTTQKWLGQAQRLQQLHESKDSLRVRIVPADELFNEFSSGTPDANAYRRYLKMLYDRAESEADMPRFLLLFGDGAWDNRMLTSDWATSSPDDFLLCYESENSFSETKCYVSDDFFGMLDDGEGARLVSADCSDVAIGRLTARSEAEAKIFVDKIVSYANNEYAGAWQNTLCFMGDDGNQNLHMNDAEEVVKVVEDNYPAYNIKKIYWDAYTRTTSSTGNTYPDVTRLIKQQMQSGALLMDYTGHGAPYTLSHEMVVKLEDFATSTSLRLPLWLTASCDIMPFDGQEENIGETAMLNKNGGAIAFYGTTRTVYAYYNRYMNKAFVRYVLGSTDGRRNTIGEAVRLAKNSLVTGTAEYDRTENKLQYTLLGDPALTLAAPTLQAVVDSINGKDVTSETVSLGAGTQVTVKGHIPGYDHFNGTITATVRDVEETIVCKMNNTDETEEALVFTDRPNTLYNGSDSIIGGQFTFTFAVPKDISYDDSEGLILLYALSHDKQLEAHGENSSFVMGSNDDEQNDGVGPSIYCYLNSSSFMNGGKTNATPYFYAELNDNDGINAAGSGIGHDLELIIDGEMSRTYNLNEYFVYDFGDYRSGHVGYSIPELTEGTHHLLFRAWDVLNNSSTAELTFVVDPQLEPSLISVICTDNPARSNTTFVINHDRTGSEMDVELEVFDPSGRKLWHHSETGLSTDNTYTVQWDLTVDGGRRLQTGVYLYRVLISSNGSTKATKARKLIVMKQ